MKPYLLILISLLLSLTTACQEKSQSKEVAGTYNLPSNENGDLFGRVDIQYLGEDTIEFKLEVATASGCTGLLEGKAKMNNQGVATYSGEDCEQLMFSFEKDRVEVEEQHCTSHHGMICHFARTYFKSETDE